MTTNVTGEGKNSLYNQSQKISNFCLSWYKFSGFSSEAETLFNYSELGGAVSQEKS
jgi:hypothetical protein